jgi:hypothetical protein
MVQRIMVACGVFLLIQGIFGSTATETAAAPVFGPVQLERTTGAPNDFSYRFRVCSPGAVYRLVVENGEKGKDRVSSAIIHLNGEEVFRYSEFSQRSGRVERTVSLQDDNTLGIKLGGGPGGFLAIHVECISGCLDIDFELPEMGTSSSSTLTIQGALQNASGETGVAITSSGEQGEVTAPAYSYGAIFAGQTYLQPGKNTITATAADACGYRVSKTEKLQVDLPEQSDSPEEWVELTPSPASGVLSTAGSLEVKLHAEVRLPGESTFTWDTDGDGIIDQKGPGLQTITAVYDAPGLYFPRLTVLDGDSRSFETTGVVHVMSLAEMDTLLQRKWASMKEGLAAGDIEKATAEFSERTRDAYRRQFTALANDLPRIAEEMGAAKLVEIEGDRAVYDLRTVRNGATYSFQLLFIRDGDGIWRIRNF